MARFPRRAPLPWPWRTWFSDCDTRARTTTSGPDGQVRAPAVRRETTDTWVLFAFYPELPPDPEFKEREMALRRVVEGFEGRYSGSQRPAD